MVQRKPEERSDAGGGLFGDSNTWGYDPVTRQRFPPDVRWTGVLRQELGAGWTIIEEGLNGRTTNLDDVNMEGRNGRAHMPVCLESHKPFDLITIMLGTNDLNTRFGRSASDIALSAASLGLLARNSAAGIAGGRPEVLLIAPPPVQVVDEFDEVFAGADEKSRHFAARYKFRAERNGLHFFDAGSVIASSPLDGIHFDAVAHTVLGRSLAGLFRQLFASA